MSHRPARINPDSLPVLVVAVVVTGLLALVSFLMSYAGLSAAAEWANVPAWLSWGVPAYIDGAILVYTIAALVHRARHEGARVAWTALSLFASLSVVANAVHAWDGAPDVLRTVIGMLIAGLAPVAVLLTTHTIARLIIAPPVPEAVPASLEEYAKADLRLTEELFKGVPASLSDAVDEAYDRVWPSEPEPVSTQPSRDDRIRALDAEGKSLRAIASAVGCSKSTVARVLDKHPDDEPAEASDVPALAIA